MRQSKKFHSMVINPHFILFAILVMAFSSHSIAQNKIVNSTFDTDLTAWDTSATSVSVVWDAGDVDGSSSSGSLHVTHDNFPGSELVAIQCIMVDENTDYMFGADFHLISGEATTYSAQLLLYQYPNTFCSGMPVGSAASTTVTTEGSWIEVSEMLTTAATAQSIHFRVLVANHGSETAVVAADNIWFLNPVEANDPVFDDGFETVEQMMGSE